MKTQSATQPPGQNTPSNPTDWVDRYGDALYHFAIGQVRDPVVAEDMVQETFLAAIKARDRFHGESSERTWLIGILRHKIYDHLRKTLRRKTVSLDAGSALREDDPFHEPLAWVHEVAAECMTPDRHVELNEFRAALEVALGKLPPRIAQVFALYEMEQQPGRDVCRALNISEANLWVMLHRARKQLREELSEWCEADPRSRAAVSLGAGVSHA
jgi:RNA polymerase sigma-70 factor (TIGR02943 family)